MIPDEIVRQSSIIRRFQENLINCSYSIIIILSLVNGYLLALTLLTISIFLYCYEKRKYENSLLDWYSDVLKKETNGN